MYVIYCLALLTFVYAAPGLAVWPSLAQPRLAYAIPVLSALVVYALALVLQACGWFAPPAVWVVSLLLSLIAFVRVRRAWRTRTAQAFPAAARLIAACIAAFALPYLVKAGLSSFDEHDEIYSWNMWAVQYTLGQAPDFAYTHVPYPQMLSVLLAYGYTLLGSLELQMPAKAMLVLFPWAMLMAVASAGPIRTGADAAKCLVVLLVIGWGAGIHLARFFDYGLADPAMTAGLAVSVALLLSHAQTQERPVLWAAWAAAVMACYAKQPALLWAAAGFPLTVLLFWRRRPAAERWFAAGTALTAALIWMLGEGRGFWLNRGVVERSLAGQGWLGHAGSAAREWLLLNPLLLVFAAAVVWAARGRGPRRTVLWALFVPAGLAWLILGAYDMRLGMHMVGVGAVLIVASEYRLPLFESRRVFWAFAGSILDRHARAVGALALAGGLAGAAVVAAGVWRAQPGIDLLHGGRNTIRQYFGRDADFVYAQLYDNPRVRLWVPSNYIYGIFYGHTPVMRPRYAPDGGYSLAAFLRELKCGRPDYVFDAGVVGFGPGDRVLRQAVSLHPEVFDRLSAAGGDAPYGYVVYAVNQAALAAL